MEAKQGISVTSIAIIVVLTLTACGGREAKPDAYWLQHPSEAEAKHKECKANEIDIKQAKRTKPTESLTADERECIYLLSRSYAIDKLEASGDTLFN